MIVCNKPKNLSLMTLKTSQLASVSCFAAVCPGYRHEMIIFVWNFTAIETISHSEQREKTQSHTDPRIQDYGITINNEANGRKIEINLI